MTKTATDEQEKLADIDLGDVRNGFYNFVNCDSEQRKCNRLRIVDYDEFLFCSIYTVDDAKAYEFRLYTLYYTETAGF